VTAPTAAQLEACITGAGTPAQQRELDNRPDAPDARRSAGAPAPAGRRAAYRRAAGTATGIDIRDACSGPVRLEMDHMAEDPARAQLACEIAAAQLEHAADQLSRVKAAVRAGDATQEHLRAARRALQTAALAYCAVGGHPPLPSGVLPDYESP
jgi:hypothetical protein